MRLTEIRVRNFRSIEGEQHISIPGNLTLVGPNNSGKTNILKSIRMLFTGHENSLGYSRDVDLTFGVGKSRTSITATFDGDPDVHKEVYEEFEELHTLQSTIRLGTQISITLYFTEANTPVYSFFPNVKRPAASAAKVQYSRTHISLVNRPINGVSLHYVPSAKSVEQIYQALLVPFLRQKVAKTLQSHIGAINAQLEDAALALNYELKLANLSDFTAGFSLPGTSIEGLLSSFDFVIADPAKTPIHEKGMGVQTTALLSAFRWITKQENADGKEVLWLLEEPESYLHPRLAANCSAILENLAKDSTVIKTTHSMAFVPQDPRYVLGTNLDANGRTVVSSYKTYAEAVSAIRNSLGVRFSDFYNLDLLNVFVEGPSDRELFSWILKLLPEDEYPLLYIRKAKLEDFGGVRHLSGFLRATYQFIRNEHASVAVFDGDEAGDKERRDLQQYFGQNKIPFQANVHFVSVRSRFAIEGLFPDEWIVNAHVEHANWFESFSVDASGQLEPFKVRDDRKALLIERLMSQAEQSSDLVWASRLAEVCEKIDSALRNQSGKKSI